MLTDNIYLDVRIEPTRPFTLVARHLDGIRTKNIPTISSGNEAIRHGNGSTDSV